MKVIGQIPPILFFCLVALSTTTETLYSAALPAIAEQMGTGGGVAKLSSAVYYLGFAVGIFTLGRVSDVYGRRPVVMFGISTYILMTLLISWATDIQTFIFLRFFQAYGASVGSVIGQAMVRDSYRGWELSYIYATASMVMSVVPSVGTTTGGYIIQYFPWQADFYILAGLATCLLLVYVKFLPETNPNIGTAKMNRFFTVLKVAIKDKVLLSYAFMVGAYNGICFGFYIQAPFVFIEGLGMRPGNYGKLFWTLTICNLTGALTARYLIKRYVSTFKMKIMGISLGVTGSLSLLIASLVINESMSKMMVAWMIFIPMGIHMIGHSLFVPMLLRHALEDYHKVTGTAGSIFGSFYYGMTALVTTLISLLHSTTINNFAMLFAGLISVCVVLFYLTFKWREGAKKYEFI